MTSYVYLNLPERTGRRRSIELQARLHRLDVRRIEALGPEQGRKVLPGSELELGELGLNATWVSMLRDLIEGGPGSEHEWLVLLEDDTLLAPRFRRRVDRVLDQVPDECMLVQLGRVTPFQPTPGDLVMAIVGAAVRYTIKHGGAAWRRRREPRQEFTTELAWGSHVVAVRVSSIPELLAAFLEVDLVTDELFKLQAREHPGTMLRYHRQLGWQLPFRSDIFLTRQLKNARKPGIPRTNRALIARWLRKASRYLRNRIGTHPRIATAVGRGRGGPGPGGP
ncbi:MAG: hypothetical protein U5K29_02680 [Acidimicrobiales bacterium]|nr:hypothetical protein [Acidimicrobiales bacterium]